jgi:colanic acid/amylovoran biosynthesis glycosyltransferase
MKVVFVTGTFPSVSETFILNQILGILMAGVRIRICALRPEQAVSLPADIRNISDCVSYRPRSPLGRVRKAKVSVAVFFQNFACAGKLWKVVLEAVRDPLIPIADYLLLAAWFLKNGAATDVVHAQFGTWGEICALLKKNGIIRVPLVVCFRGGDSSVVLKKYPHAYRTVYEQADICLAVSHYIAGLHLAAGCPDYKISVHRSGIDLGRFRFDPERRKACAGSELLVIARLTEVKGVRFAIQALEVLRRSGFETHLTIVGDGPLRGELERLAHNLGLQDRLVFAGDQPTEAVPGYLERAAVLLVPSIIASDGAQEGLPNVIKEAMAIGVPVVATSTGGIPELVEDGITGFLVGPKDPDALACRTMEMLGDPEKLERITAMARLKIEAEYDNTRLNEKLLGMYARMKAAAVDRNKS